MEIKVKRKESGQALVIILLVMAVGLTVALSIVSRSVTDIRISREQEESARAFSVAEAGIEESLRAGAATTVELEGVRAEVIETGQGGGTEFVFEKVVDEGDTQTVWLVNHVNGELGTNFYSGTITVYWGNEGQAGDQDGTPALEASIIYDSGGYKVARYAFDPNSSRTITNKFDSALVGSSTVDNQTLPFKAEVVPLPAGNLYALRLRLLYNSSPQVLAVSGSAAFPTQGKCYESTEQCLSQESPVRLGNVSLILFRQQYLIMFCFQEVI